MATDFVQKKVTWKLATILTGIERGTSLFVGHIVDKPQNTVILIYGFNEKKYITIICVAHNKYSWTCGYPHNNLQSISWRTWQFVGSVKQLQMNERVAIQTTSHNNEIEYL